MRQSKVRSRMPIGVALARLVGSDGYIDLGTTIYRGAGKRIYTNEINSQSNLWDMRFLEALTKPGREDEPQCDAPLNAYGVKTTDDDKSYIQVPGGMDLFGAVRKDAQGLYPYGRLDEHVYEKYSNDFYQDFNGKNVLETCSGVCESTAFMLKVSKSRPAIFIRNDIEPYNMELSERNLLDAGIPDHCLYEAVGNFFKSKTWQRNHHVDLEDDFDDDFATESMSPLYQHSYQEWIQQNPHGDARLKEWTYLKNDFLQALKQDPNQTTHLTSGVTANDFEMPAYLGWMMRSFKPDSVSYQSICTTVSREALVRSYQEPVIIKQLILAGTARHLRDRGYLNFDPREIGAGVDVERVDSDRSLVTFCVFPKKEPNRRFPLTPIRKISENLLRRNLADAGITAYDPLRSDSTLSPGTSHALWRLTIPSLV